MAIYVMGDTHLSLGTSKPMDIFPGWEGYLTRLEENWRRVVTDEDTVVINGDVSWAMKLEDTREDFAFLNSLPGQKLLSKGNHDYWWTTMKKMNTFLEQQGFSTLHFLFNNSYYVEGINICGTRGWLFDVGEAHDQMVMNREIGRLKMSLEAAQPEGERVAFLHYPPVYYGATSPEIIQVLEQYDVKRCYYGHLHGKSIRYAVQGEVNGIEYRLASADGLGFCPLKI